MADPRFPRRGAGAAIHSPGDRDIAGAAEVGVTVLARTKIVPERPEAGRGPEDGDLVAPGSVIVRGDRDIPGAPEIITSHPPNRPEGGGGPEDRRTPGVGGAPGVGPGDRDVAGAPERIDQRPVEGRKMAISARPRFPERER